MWLAKVGSERLDEIADPEKAIMRGAERHVSSRIQTSQGAEEGEPA